jgi:hypothetical protein
MNLCKHGDEPLCSIKAGNFLTFQYDVSYLNNDKLEMDGPALILLQLDIISERV